jgi:myo-inositol 2-dehydrogenase / D-chiro-inositol 1-dehydrogenase
MSKLTRRGALTAAAANFMILKPQTAFGSQANSAVRFGIIGTGGRGTYVGAHMADDPRTRLVAVCDVFPDRIDNIKSKVKAAENARSYKNHKDLLEQPDIDAVLIASPVFLHPEHVEAAVEAGKHIYCEKPGGADVAGVKRLMKAIEKADRSKSIQFGFQQRFSPEYLRAYRIMEEGKVGAITLMMSYWVLGNPPAQGFKSRYPEEQQKLRHWGSWNDYSGGAIVEQDCHGVDTLNWFAKGHPVKAHGTGGLRYKTVYGDWDSDHHNITYYYSGNLEGWLISIKHTAGYRDVKEQFYGPQGMLETTRTYYKWHGPIAASPLKNADDLRDRSLIERGDSKREITIDAVQAFYTSIIEKKPIHMGKDAAESTLTALLGRMAYQKKREVTWDELMQSA